MGPPFKRLAAVGVAVAALFFLSSLSLRAAQIPGSVLWSVETGNPVASSPAIGADGTIYAGSGYLPATGGQTSAQLYSISPQGATNWFRILGRSGPGGASPAIGADGTIYFGATDRLFSFNSDGTTNWIFNTGGSFMASPAIAADGTIYVHARGTSLNRMFAARTDGKTNWVFTLGGGDPAVSYQVSSPAIGPDGTIYAASGAGRVVANTPQGRTNWIFNLADATYSSPAIGPDGTIYIGCDNGQMYAIDWRGYKKWAVALGLYVECSPAVSADGTIYIAPIIYGNFSAFNPDGTTKWVSAVDQVSASPTVTDGGLVYVAS